MDERQLITTLLVEQDVPCPRCGYNLRGLESDCCPECGDRLTLRVSLAEPRLAPYITTLVGCSLGLGASGFLGLLAATAAPRMWWTSVSGLAMLMLLGLTAAGFPAVLLLRRRIRRRSQRWQWVLAVITWLVVVVLASIVLGTFDD